MATGNTHRLVLGLVYRIAASDENGFVFAVLLVLVWVLILSVSPSSSSFRRTLFRLLLLELVLECHCIREMDGRKLYELRKTICFFVYGSMARLLRF